MHRERDQYALGGAWPGRGGVESGEEGWLGWGAMEGCRVCSWGEQALHKGSRGRRGREGEEAHP